MAKLYGFTRSMDPITEFDAGDEDVGLIPTTYPSQFQPRRDCMKSTGGMKKEFTDWKH